MRILVVGKGAREHAIASALARDSDTTKLFAAPGNPGMEAVAECLPTIGALDVESVVRFAKKENIDLVVVGPEAPLAAGIVDACNYAGIRAFGPTKSAARLESSKAFTKQLCATSGIPTPRWTACSSMSEVRHAIDVQSGPWVIKDDGLASGKGVLLTRDRREAEEFAQIALRRESSKVVIEEFVDGWEASFMLTVSRGRGLWMTPVFQDYKPVFDGDMGPNTGGMGIYSPVPGVTRRLLATVREDIFERALTQLRIEGMEYSGVMCLNAIVRRTDSQPMLLEFNARFGDPEAEGLAPLIQGGFSAHLHGVASGSTSLSDPACLDEAVVGVVVAAAGYPLSPKSGDVIATNTSLVKELEVFHAGTKRRHDGEIITDGGRVLVVVGRGESVESARSKVYGALDAGLVKFQGQHYRSDIGNADVRRRKELL